MSLSFFRFFPLPSSIALAAGLVLGLTAIAPTAHAESAEDVITQRLGETVPGLQVHGVTESAVPGLYEVRTNNRSMIYATEDGEYIIAGEMLQLTDKGVVNVTEQTRSVERARVISGYDHEELITYRAEGEEKAVIGVFTDIDCPYCRKLHDEMDRLNELGITVNYYAYPRSGPGTPSFRKYESVWCAEDQQAAMDQAKAGETVPQASCDNPVGEQFQLGGQVGVSGTPAIVLEDGKMINGYVPADKLAEGLGLM
ncbi:thioredoxin fold domain-containing protein [Marinobacter sp. LN3S78]|uniref:thioredoxin fold domain-containing protein n=1 Tax=Marinobacter sp. LN3S78 TaxID=3382300 RepID=UPI00387B0EAA